jgi:hypothetical protein
MGVPLDAESVWDTRERREEASFLPLPSVFGVVCHS